MDDRQETRYRPDNYPKPGYEPPNATAYIADLRFCRPVILSHIVVAPHCPLRDARIVPSIARSSTDSRHRGTRDEAGSTPRIRSLCADAPCEVRRGSFTLGEGSSVRDRGSTAGVVAADTSSPRRRGGDTRPRLEARKEAEPRPPVRMDTRSSNHPSGAGEGDCCPQNPYQATRALGRAPTRYYPAAPSRRLHHCPGDDPARVRDRA